MAKCTIPQDKASQTLGERTHCKHGHGIEHQRLNIRGHKICRECDRQAGLLRADVCISMQSFTQLS
jgi:hypothetical protein